MMPCPMSVHNTPVPHSATCIYYRGQRVQAETLRFVEPIHTSPPVHVPCWMCQISVYIYLIFYLSSTLNEVAQVVDICPRENMGQFILHNWFHGCWWPGDVKNRHGMSLGVPAYSDFTTTPAKQNVHYDISWECLFLKLNAVIIVCCQLKLQFDSMLENLWLHDHPKSYHLFPKSAYLFEAYSQMWFTREPDCTCLYI